jgi:hypothetical protein
MLGLSVLMIFKLKIGKLELQLNLKNKKCFEK